MKWPNNIFSIVWPNFFCPRAFWNVLGIFNVSIPCIKYFRLCSMLQIIFFKYFGPMLWRWSKHMITTIPSLVGSSATRLGDFWTFEGWQSFLQKFHKCRGDHLGYFKRTTVRNKPVECQCDLAFRGLIHLHLSNQLESQFVLWMLV